MGHRQKKVAELIKQNAAQFLAEESDNTSLITVTDADVSPDLDQASVYISVFPDEQREAGLAFAQRKQRELQEYLKSHTELRRVPRVSISLDEGELKRQRIDELSREL